MFYLEILAIIALFVGNALFGWGAYPNATGNSLGFVYSVSNVFLYIVLPCCCGLMLVLFFILFNRIHGSSYKKANCISLLVVDVLYLAYFLASLYLLGFDVTWAGNYLNIIFLLSVILLFISFLFPKKERNS